MMLVVTRHGTVRTVYCEAIELSEIGRIDIRRGSHVEPNANGQWMADLSPVDGPTLGPFDNRSEALAAELSWLNEHWLLSVTH
jgi:hypothetical protein